MSHLRATAVVAGVAAVLAASVAAASDTTRAAPIAAGTAASRAQPALRVIAGPDPSIAGQMVTISGRARHARRAVLWQRVPRGRRFRFRAVAFARVRHGRFVFHRAPVTNRLFYVTAAGRRSRIVHQRVYAIVTLSATLASGPEVRFTGTVYPAHRGERVVLERQAGGRWVPFARPWLRAGSQFQVVRPVPSATVVRATLPGNRRNIRSFSPPVPLGSAPTVTATLGPDRALPAGFFGVNWDYPGAAMFARDLPSEYAALAALHPGTLRWPDGTGANYFQWQRGYPTNLGEQHGFVDTLSDLAAAYRATGAPPLFDLNVMTSTLSSQVQMLHQAQSLGVPIRYLELGNEFYLGFSDYTKAFPTAADYGRLVGQWTTTLHRDFPGALVAAVATAGSYSARERAWNQLMLAAARLSGGLPDAVTLHDKPSWGTGPVTAANLPTLFGGPYQAVTSANSALAALPDHLPAWMTEYNLHPDSASDPAQKVYGHALFVAEFALLIQRVSRASLVDYWTSLQGSENGAYIGSPSGGLALTPGGLALQWVQTAAAGAAESAPIAFGGAPVLSSTRDPAVVGYRFSDGKDVIVNLSGQPVTVPSGAAVPAGSPYQQFAGDPTAEVTYASQLGVQSGTVSDTLTLPPYSLTSVG